MSTLDSPEAVAVRPPLALIAGPTASGKSDIAVRLALELEARGRHAVVVNADSAQVYRDLRVLSARPADEEMQDIEHRLFGEWDGSQACSAADWATAARKAIAEIHAAGDVPILSGGTGLYIRALLDGIAPVPRIDPDVRAEIRTLPVSEAYAALQREDPERAAALAAADGSRIARALEVIRSTGRGLAAWQAEHRDDIGSELDVHPIVLLPGREALYARCDLRFADMVENGAIAEVEALLARHLDPALPVMRAIGVPEITAYLGGGCSLDEAIARGAQATRNYAKRQYTWFRRQPPPEWPRIESFDFDISTIFSSLFHT